MTRNVLHDDTMKTSRQFLILAVVFVSGGILGAGGLWLGLHPITRTVAAWLQYGGSRASTVEVMCPPWSDGSEPPLIRLSTSPKGTEWTLLLLGKPKANSKDQVLSLLSRLAHYEPNLVIVIQPGTGLEVESLRDAIREITGRGFHRFHVQDILWGTTEIKKDGFVY